MKYFISANWFEKFIFISHFNSRNLNTLQIPVPIWYSKTTRWISCSFSLLQYYKLWNSLSQCEVMVQVQALFSAAWQLLFWLFLSAIRKRFSNRTISSSVYVVNRPNKWFAIQMRRDRAEREETRKEWDSTKVVDLQKSFGNPFFRFSLCYRQPICVCVCWRQHQEGKNIFSLCFPFDTVYSFGLVPTHDHSKY